MKGLTRFFLAFSLAAALLGCQQKQEVTAHIALKGDSVSLESGGISAPAEGTEVELSFSSALSWMITSDLTKAHAPWIVINPPAGLGGDFTVTIMVNENPDKTPRTGYVTLASGDVKKVIEVTQAGRASIGISGISLSETEMEVYPGEEFTLVASVLPTHADEDATVSWSSSNEDVATVSDEGVVMAVAEGSAVISASAGEFTASCEVTVLHVVVPVEGIQLQESLVITEGDTYQLTAALVPENADPVTIRWSSSDEDIATVSEDGLVTAVFEGSATITASAGEFSASCEVSVLHRVIPVESVTLDITEETLPVGEFLTLVATVNPDNADDQAIVWTSSDEAVATVDENGRVKAIAEGTAVITAACGGKSATCTITVPHVNVPVESVELSATSAKIHVGETLQLTATILPADADYTSVVWTSSAPGFATVSETGLVTGVAPGKLTVTVSVGGKEAVCEITVLPNGSTGEDMGDPIDVDPWK